MLEKNQSRVYPDEKEKVETTYKDMPFRVVPFENRSLACSDTIATRIEQTDGNATGWKWDTWSTIYTVVNGTIVGSKKEARTAAELSVLTHGW